MLHTSLSDFAYIIFLLRSHVAEGVAGALGLETMGGNEVVKEGEGATFGDEEMGFKLMDNFNTPYFAVSIKDFWLPLDATVEDMAAFRDKCASYGVDPYILGPIYMSTPEQVEEAFAYVRRFGSEMFIGVPSYDVLDLVVRKVRETGR